MGNFKYWALLAVGMMMGGCAQTTWQTEKTVSPDYAGRPKAIFAVYYTDHRIDKSRLAEEVEQHLQACGVKVVSSIQPGSSYSGSPADFAGGVPSDTEGFLVLSGKDTFGTRMVDAMYGSSKKWVGQYFTAEFHDRAGKRLVWNSEIYLPAGNGISTYSPVEKGQNLAKGLVGYLVADGIIRTCPAGGRSTP